MGLRQSDSQSPRKNLFYLPPLGMDRQRRGHMFRKIVELLDNSGIVTNTFSSIAEASKFLGVSTTTFRSHLRKFGAVKGIKCRTRKEKNPCSVRNPKMINNKVI